MNKFTLNNFTSETDKSVSELRNKLDNFYLSSQEYTAFHKPNYKPDFWHFIKKEIIKCIKIKDKCRVLEIGAGCTGFADYLSDIRGQVIFDVQDVTPINKDYLMQHADNVYIRDIRDIAASYDIIFSTFVWEHVTTPQAVLEHLIKILNTHGSIFIISPRYDFPFYLSPSAKHLSKLRQILVSIWLIVQRLKVIITSQPNFFIHLDPSFLHNSWFRDADAIHWVSFWDLKAYINGNYAQKLKLHRIKMNHSNNFKLLFWQYFLLLFVRIEKK